MLYNRYCKNICCSFYFIIICSIIGHIFAELFGLLIFLLIFWVNFVTMFFPLTFPALKSSLNSNLLCFLLTRIVKLGLVDFGYVNMCSEHFVIENICCIWNVGGLVSIISSISLMISMKYLLGFLV